MARERYDRIKNELLLTGSVDEARADELEMLREFLRTVNFGSLRREYEPEIQAGRKVMITLFRVDKGIDYRVEIF